MQYILFGAIDIGSSEVELKIFELSKSKGMKEIDSIRHRLELGKDTYATGKISTEKVEALCKVLLDFVKIMEGYQVAEYRAYATSAIREAKNKVILLDYIKSKTGVKIEVLGNAEQRFLDYKSIAFQANEFNKIIEKGTAIVDVGGGSIQISLFDKDSLIFTQNIRIGNLINDPIEHACKKGSNGRLSFSGHTASCNAVVFSTLKNLQHLRKQRRRILHISIHNRNIIALCVAESSIHRRFFSKVTGKGNIAHTLILL